MNKLVKRLLLALGSILLLVVLVVGGYVLYMVLQYSRIPDHTKLEIANPVKEIMKKEGSYRLITYNIGFGAYNHEFSFFMDSGEMNDGTKVSGNGARAASLEVVMQNTEGAINAVKNTQADFYLFQEVDEDADRSWHVNQTAEVANAFPGFASVYASNFHSAFLFYPLQEPHGAVQAGLLTLGRYQISEAVRRSYPVDESFPTKFFDLDRCFSVHRVPVEGGGELVIINSHMSAYDEGGGIRAQQMQMMAEILQEEYAKGNWVIIGGDFNHALGQTMNSFETTQKTPEWVFAFDESLLPEGFSVVYAENNDDVATCRSTDMPYVKGVNYHAVLDGFVVSDNVQVAANNIDTDFMFSDHNPVLLEFTLQ